MLGSYTVNVNDATILKEILNTSQALNNLIREHDKFVLDRGFRDVIGDLEKEGFNVFMPALKGKRAHLSREESNFSRYVTKVRWPVEAIHGILKQIVTTIRLVSVIIIHEWTIKKCMFVLMDS